MESEMKLLAQFERYKIVREKKEKEDADEKEIEGEDEEEEEDKGKDEVAAYHLLIFLFLVPLENDFPK